MFNSKFRRPLVLFLFLLAGFSSKAPCAADSQHIDIQIDAGGIVTIKYPSNENETAMLSFDLGNQVQPEAQSSVISLASNGYDYVYRVNNAASAKQALRQIVFLMSRNFSFVSKTDTAALAKVLGFESNEDPNFINASDTFEKLFLPTPFTLGRLPTGWSKFRTSDIGSIAGVFYDSGMLISSSAKRNFELQPGQSSEFSFQSIFLPEIAEAWFLGKTDKRPESPKTIFHELSRQIKKKIVSIRHPLNSGVRRYVLFPSANYLVTPETDCDTFLVYLISQTRKAAEIGWIKHDLRNDRDDDDDHGKGKGAEKGKKKGHDKDGDEGDDNGDDDLDDADKRLPGVAKSIIQKLTKVRRECLRGKFGNAREKLRALIKQVNAQRGKHLTEEAYALIKFNAEFLLEKL